MIKLTKLMIKLARMNGTYERLYADEVNRRIRRRYTMDDELAILRQRGSKPAEFEVYNEYAELCKTEAKAYLDRIEG